MQPIRRGKQHFYRSLQLWLCYKRANAIFSGGQKFGDIGVLVCLCYFLQDGAGEFATIYSYTYVMYFFLPFGMGPMEWSGVGYEPTLKHTSTYPTNFMIFVNMYIPDQLVSAVEYPTLTQALMRSPYLIVAQRNLRKGKLSDTRNLLSNWPTQNRCMRFQQQSST